MSFLLRLWPSLRFARLSGRRFQSDQSVCGNPNLGTRRITAPFNPVELQQTLEHSIADRYRQSVPQSPNARPQMVEDLTLPTIRCIRFHQVVVRPFATSTIEQSHRAYSRRDRLIERNADTEFSAPDHVAGQLQSII